MDRCSEHKDRQLRDYFLNRLTPEEVEVFQFHLFHCETCRMNLERMRLLVHEGEEEVGFRHQMRKCQTLKNVV